LDWRGEHAIGDESCGAHDRGGDNISRHGPLCLVRCLKPQRRRVIG
jgi:hypothetical protein